MPVRETGYPTVLLIHLGNFNTADEAEAERQTEIDRQRGESFKLTQEYTHRENTLCK